MAGSIFEAFQAGYEGGNALAQQRRAQNASRQATARYQAGDYRGAESAFLSEGMLGEAAQIGDMGERNRHRETRESVRTAMTGEGTAMERFGRGRDAAMEAGDFDLASQLSGMSAEEQQNAAATATRAKACARP